MKPAYRTDLGLAYCMPVEEFVASPLFKPLIGKVDLILTSPPFPLLSPKAYGNKVGEQYSKWLADIMMSLKCLLRPRGSLVLEIGNSWERGQPTMSTLPIETLLRVKNDVGLQVCEQFIWSNPNKLPGPATWVNIQRIRVKDSFTHIWWYSTTPNPRANNRHVLSPYTHAMEKLLARQSYNQGVRPSGHTIGAGFLTANGGSIPSNVLTFANTKESRAYREWCKSRGVPQHPARMPAKIPEFFIRFLTNKNGLVLDPFGGSNTTGRVAESLSRRWITIEREEKYVIGSEGRFKD